jgi:3-hydroxymyristoyl/3-hydroxydecanoyl-(acyl carrier protein) dehydratase
MSDTFQAALRIEANHPALAGHFPGDPVVPGVVLLERVAAACKSWRGGRVARLDAKFLQPLRPEEDAAIVLEGQDGRIRFSVARADGTAVARGTLETAQG